MQEAIRAASDANERAKKYESSIAGANKDAANALNQAAEQIESQKPKGSNGRRLRKGLARAPSVVINVNG